MSIKSYVDELEQLNAEIKRNNCRNKLLRGRVAELEKNITAYLEEKDLNGLKYNGKAVINDNKVVRYQKSKKEKETDIITLLKNLGVDEPKEAYTKLLDAQKGVAVSQSKIKIKKLTNTLKQS